MTDPSRHGSLPEEALRLVDALQGWLAKSDTGAQDTWARATAGAEVGSGWGGSPECTACPICRSIRYIRTMSPEAVEHLVDAGSAFAAALQDLRSQAEARKPAEPGAGDEQA